MGEHSPTPWTVAEVPGPPPRYEVRDADGKPVATFDDRELAERAAAAVNALAGAGDDEPREPRGDQQ